MRNKTVLVTGAGGLVGSAAVHHFIKGGAEVVGIDNDSRMQFFGPEGSVRNNIEHLQRLYGSRYHHHLADIRHKESIHSIFQYHRPDYIIHAAAQCSHDKAAEIIYDDFFTNAVGTLNVLEAVRTFSKDAPFIHVSTNKVYGDLQHLPLKELDTRFAYSDPNLKGIDESFSIDQSMHSVFGVSKLSGDVLAQEYGRYFGMPVGIFRGGCLTGEAHAAVPLHGFLAYLVKTAVQNRKHPNNKRTYQIIGYKGKQVRDQIHADDLIDAFQCFLNDPNPGEVYNIGGGPGCNGSILECIEILDQLLEQNMSVSYLEQARRGDHVCYISNIDKFRKRYPQFQFKKSETLSKLIEHMTTAALNSH